ncbi:ferredoxin [Enterobacter sichuanensis]|uniref:Ferredoxin n=1 Tax=Enterobacter sichuanensis TaxID=2071710 RepID=A0A0F1ANU9_9ENTR|nr:ferredoxin [Enterobacter sichuanensis]
MLACKNRRLDKSAMTTPEKKPKKSARQCRSTAGRLYPEDRCTAVGAPSKMVNLIMQSECQVLTRSFRGANRLTLTFTHLNQAQNAH